MRFVSNRAEYKLCIRGGKWEYRRHSDGTDERVQTEQEFWVAFRQAELRPHEKIAAADHFIGGMGNRGDGSMKGLGAHPLMQGAQAGAGVENFDPRWRFSVYDTDWIEDAELRAEAEAKLTDYGIVGNEVLLVLPEAVPAPWPSFDDVRGVKGSPTPMRLVEMARDFGVSLERCLAYERVAQNREDVVEAFEEAIRADAETAALDLALSAVVPD